MMAALIVMSLFALVGVSRIRHLAPPSCGSALAIEATVYTGMNTKQQTRYFTLSDDALIMEQPVTALASRHWQQCCRRAKRD